MSKNIEHLQHKKSNVVIEGKPKLPTAEVLVEGELAVNYAEGYETISLRNSSSGMATFSSDDYYTKMKLGSGFTGVNSANTVTSVIEENEEITASALNDLNDRIVEIDDSVNDKVDNDTFSASTAATNARIDDLLVLVEDDENVVSSALNDLEGRKLDASAYTPVDISQYYTKSETSGKTEIANALQTKSNANHNQASNTITAMTGYVVASTSGDVATSDTLNVAIGKLERNDNDIKRQIGSGFTVSSITEVIEENEEVISSALNDLNGRVNTHTSDLSVHIKNGGEVIYKLENMSGKAGGTNLCASWSGDCDGITELYDGLNIQFKIPIAGHASGCTIAINGGEQHRCVLNASSNYTTNYPVGSIVRFVYDSNQNGDIYTGSSTPLSVQGVWKVSDYNTTYSVVSQTYLLNGEYKAYTNIYRYQILLPKDEEYLLPINTTSNSTASTKVLTTEEFDIFGPIYYYGSTTTVNANAVIPTKRTYISTSINLAYSFNTTTTLTPSKNVYMVVVPQANNKAKLHSSPISQELPTTDDGLVYVLLGVAYSTSQIALEFRHPLYHFKNGKIREYTGANDSAYMDVDSELTPSSSTSNNLITAKAVYDAISSLETQMEVTSNALNDLNGRVNEKASQDDLNTVLDDIESITKDVEDLTNTVVMSIATTDARGYGESTPTLAQYTGNKSILNGILSHFKLGWFDSGGTLVKECAPGRISAARDGSEIAIDGTNGDLMVYIDTNIYRDRATVSGLNVQDSTATTHNVIGLGLAPHQLGGKTAKKFEPFGFTPHCAKYSNSKGYSYYDGGNVQCSINSLTSSVNALNKGGGYMGLYYEFYEIWLIAMYMELGTLDYTNDTYFGNGCTNYTPTASNWLKGGSGCMYTSNRYGSFWNNTVSSYNFAEMLEAQRIMDGVVKAGLTDSIGSTSVMTYNDSGDVVIVDNVNLTTWDGASAMTRDKKYFTIQNVTNCQGLGDGVMTGIVNIFVKGTDRIRKYSHPIYRGLDLLSGFFVQLEGLYYVVKHTGRIASLAQSQELFYAQSWKEVPTSTSVYTNANSIVSAATEEGLTDNPVLVSTYTSAGSYPTGSDGWGKETDYNVSLFAHKVIGGAQHTYECGNIWYRGLSWSSPAGTDMSGYLTSNAKSANASVVGCLANKALAGRTLFADFSVADSSSTWAGGFAHPQIKVR